MSWISTLAETYDFLSQSLQQDPGSVGGFIPIGIINLQAQLEITLSENSDLIRARFVDKSDSSTFVPVTENSANRTRKAVPHPIFDNLEYMAGDYERYSKKDKTNKFKEYLEQLKKWYDYDSSNEMLRIVYEYLEKELLVKDLIALEILKVDPKDSLRLDESQKHQNKMVNKLFIRIAIEKDGVSTSLWENDEFLNSFTAYYLADNQNPVGLCYVSGEQRKLAILHGKYIRFPGDGAKLISSNDTSNYTFRGRFESSDQAVGISIEASQKAHSALRWLIKNQGERANGMVIVAFGMNVFVPQPLEGSLSLFEQMSSNDLIPPKADTSEDVAQEIKKAIHGYRSNLNPKEQVNIIVLDNATTGRLAILNYQELNAADYLDNLSYYHESMKWEHSYWDSSTKEFRHYVGVPKSSDLINYVFGAERQGLMEVGQKDKYYNELLRRLLPTIVNRGRMPTDFVNRAFQNAVTPMSKSHSNWQKCTSIACGIIKKYYQERRMVNYSMSLDPQIRDRSYLYGRLLAVAEKIERDAMGNGSAERTTNAMRLMAVMSKKPYTTWGRLENKLQPYLRGIPRSQREFWSKKIGEIMDLFDYDDFLMNKQLEGAYVLGYHCQLQDFYKKKENSEYEEEK